MALIIEGGSGVAGANTYASVAALRGYAALRGITLPVDDASCEILLIKAMDYLSGVTGWQGVKANPDNPLDFPRTGVVVDGVTLLSTAIPSTLITAQIALAIEAIKTDLQPNQMPTDKGAIIEASAQTGTHVKYAAPVAGNARTKPFFAKVDALLSKLLSTGSGFGRPVWIKRA